LVTKASSATNAVAVSNTSRLTLLDLWRLAVEWCPKKARWPHLIDDHESWGPAHELGHALIEARVRWNQNDYGHCPLAMCNCRRELCDTYEVAAMLISHALLRATGNEFMSEREYADTTDIDLVDPVHNQRAKALLRKKGLWPVPRTKRSLEAALRRRLGKPRGSKPRSPPGGGMALRMLTNILLNPAGL
jgi:hypothetical protein